MSVARQHAAFPEVNGCKAPLSMLAVSAGLLLAEDSATRRLRPKTIGVLAVNKPLAPKPPGFDSLSFG